MNIEYMYIIIVLTCEIYAFISTETETSQNRRHDSSDSSDGYGNETLFTFETLLTDNESEKKSEVNSRIYCRAL